LVRATGTDEKLTPPAVSAMLRKSGPMVNAVGAPSRCAIHAEAVASAKSDASPVAS
jgi:hypothetical protein